MAILTSNVIIQIVNFIYERAEKSEDITDKEQKFIDDLFKILIDKKNGPKFNLSLIENYLSTNSHESQRFKINIESTNNDNEASKENFLIEDEDNYIKINSESLTGANEKYLAIKKINRFYDLETITDEEFQELKNEFLSKYLIKNSSKHGNPAEKLGLKDSSQSEVFGLIAEQLQLQIFGEEGGYKSHFVVKNGDIKIAVRLNKGFASFFDFVKNNHDTAGLKPQGLVKGLILAKLCNFQDMHTQNIMVKREGDQLKFLFIDHDNFHFKKSHNLIKPILDYIKKFKDNITKNDLISTFNQNFNFKFTNEEEKTKYLERMCYRQLLVNKYIPRLGKKAFVLSLILLIILLPLTLIVALIATILLIILAVYQYLKANKEDNKIFLKNIISDCIDNLKRGRHSDDSKIIFFTEKEEDFFGQLLNTMSIEEIEQEIKEVLQLILPNGRDLLDKFDKYLDEIKKLNSTLNDAYKNEIQDLKIDIKEIDNLKKTLIQNVLKLGRAFEVFPDETSVEYKNGEVNLKYLHFIRGS